VTDVLGRPVKSARVYVLPRMGEPHQTKTDTEGRYTIDISTSGTHGIVIAIDKAHVRTVLVKAGVSNTLDVEVGSIRGRRGDQDRGPPRPEAGEAKPKQDGEVAAV
jgi:hypothetical protein